MKAYKRSHIHTDRPVGERIADGVATTMGSWAFIITQTVVVAFWIGFNLFEFFWRPFDPFPFILLNLLFSTQAAYAAPVIMMSQNRQAAKDRLRDDRDDEEIGEIHTMQRDQMGSHAFQIEELKKQSIMLKQLLGRH